MRNLYAALNRLLFAFSVTSVSALEVPDFITFSIVHASLALLVFFTIFEPNDCLTIIGTEGSLSFGGEVNLTLRFYDWAGNLSRPYETKYWS